MDTNKPLAEMYAYSSGNMMIPGGGPCVFYAYDNRSEICTKRAQEFKQLCSKNDIATESGMNDIGISFVQISGEDAIHKYRFLGGKIVCTHALKDFKFRTDPAREDVIYLNANRLSVVEDVLKDQNIDYKEVNDELMIEGDVNLLCVAASGGQFTGSQRVLNKFVVRSPSR